MSQINIYKLKSSAVRAAKKMFGEDFAQKCSIKEVSADQWAIVVEEIVSFEPQITKEVEVLEQLEAIEADVKAKKAKKREIESRKPVFIPAEAHHERMAEIIKPDPIASPSDDEEIEPPADSEVPCDQELFDMDKGMAEADRQANLAVVNIDPARPRMSTIPLPTKRVWAIADAMMAQLGSMPKRKDVIEECVRQGIAYGTARTQHQHWFKCYNDSICAPLATIGKDGKIVPPTK